VFGLDELRSAGAFLATEMNGAPLGPDHGQPVRLVVPGWYACAAIKWVNEIVLLDDEAPATDHMREYAGRTHQDATIPALARDFEPATIDPAAVPVRVERQGRTVRIVGLAWGGASALKIRLSPELSWMPVAEMEGRTSGSWTLWSHTVPALAPGRYRIELALSDPAVRARRLDARFYARDFLVDADEDRPSGSTIGLSRWSTAADLLLAPPRSCGPVTLKWSCAGPGGEKQS
jgi:hypothetical protein